MITVGGRQEGSTLKVGSRSGGAGPLRNIDENLGNSGIKKTETNHKQFDSYLRLFQTGPLSSVSVDRIWFSGIPGAVTPLSGQEGPL